jgi:hypothetical protein
MAQIPKKKLKAIRRRKAYERHTNKGLSRQTMQGLLNQAARVARTRQQKKVSLVQRIIRRVFKPKGLR